MPNFSQRSKNNLVGVHPNLVKVMEAAIKDSPIDFTITEGLRTTKRQQELYAQGRTKPGTKVTNADGVKSKSNHQAKSDGFGHAVDIYPFVDGQVRVNEKYVIPYLEKITAHIEKKAKELGIGISLGIKWKFYDPPHVELKS